MIRPFVSALGACLVLACGAPVRADEACWKLVYSAMEHSAGARHVPYISYHESERITMDGNRFEYSDARITYRDDGLAYVDDDRWDHPFMSRLIEPGPPVLGPYGEERRASWLSYAQPFSSMKIIANTSTGQRHECVAAGTELLGGVQYAHVVFPDAPASDPSIKAMWIDPATFDVKRLVASAWICFGADGAMINDLANFDVNFETINDVAVVRNISWTYSFKVYDQRSIMRADYAFKDYRFDAGPPAGTMFASNR